MKMKKNLGFSFCCLFPAFLLLLLNPISFAQLTPSERRILFQVQRFLEYPQSLQGWNNWTNFCYLPSSPSLKIVCSETHITELTIIGNKSSSSSSPVESLSRRFSIDSFFTVLSKLSNLKVLSLVSLGLWGPLPPKINRFRSLQVLNFSSNFIYGEIPSSITSMKNLSRLVLAGNLLNGSVPDLKTLASLQELNLGDNKLGPGFPSVGKNLVSLVLRNNSLRSKIPSEFKQLNKLQNLDLSSNNILGNVPDFLFSLPSIQYVNLAENQLSGVISVSIACGSSLKFVDISHNFLVGKLPSCIGSNSKSSNLTVLYSGNCLSMRGQQHPTSYCKKEEALAVKPPDRKSQKKKDSGMKLGLILGIIGGVVGISLLLVLLLLFIMRSKSKAERSDDLHRSVADKFSVHASPKTPNVDARRVPQTVGLAAIGLQPYKIFTLEELEDATDNFDQSNLIGEGSEGQIYKGWIRDGSVVLVKCVKLKQKNLTQSLMQQHMDVLPNLRHRHLVSLMGHCVITAQDHPHQTTSTVFIVYEHISNGSLRDHFTDWRKKERLKWPQRMAISIGITRGIQFLHTGVAPGIFGNNIKIENILLDDSLNAKVSGYKIPLPSNHIDSNDIAEKEDIYQLGVILLEVITGKAITSASEVEDLKDELERGLSEAASVLRDVTDPTIKGSYAYESLRTTVQITINCLSKVSSMRPSVEDVLWNLQYSIQVQENWTSSGNLGTKM